VLLKSQGATPITFILQTKRAGCASSDARSPWKISKLDNNDYTANAGGNLKVRCINFIQAGEKVAAATD